MDWDASCGSSFLLKCCLLEIPQSRSWRGGAQMHSASRAREVVVFCPYLLINKSASVLRVRDTTPYATSPSIAPPPSPDGTATPTMFRCLLWPRMWPVSDIADTDQILPVSTASGAVSALLLVSHMQGQTAIDPPDSGGTDQIVWANIAKTTLTLLSPVLVLVMYSCVRMLAGSSARGVVRLCMHSAFWSRSINLESLGMAGNVSHYPSFGPGPCKPSSPLGVTLDACLANGQHLDPLACPGTLHPAAAPPFHQPECTPCQSLADQYLDRSAPFNL